MKTDLKGDELAVLPMDKVKILSLQEDLWLLYKNWVQDHIHKMSKERQQEMNKAYESIKGLVSVSGRLINDEMVRQTETKKLNIHPKVPKEKVHVIEFLIRMIQPEKIFLVNKNVLIDNQTHSGMELMIILPEGNHSKFTDLEPYLSFALLGRPKLTCSLHTSPRLTDAFKENSLMYLINCVKDNLIYDDGKKALPKMNIAKLRECKEQTEKLFHSNFKIASSFFKEAEDSLNDGNYTLATFFLHQTTELTYRALIAALTGADKKTHSIRNLKLPLERIAPTINRLFPDDSEEEIYLLSTLEDAYTKARYCPEFEVEDRIALLLFERVKKLQELALDTFNSHLKLYEIAD